MPVEVKNVGATFTFQSGYIQMVRTWESIWDIINFTFQSGYIQMVNCRPYVLSFLVFTFQSGYIQIFSSTCSNMLINAFTFQSGYIQICPAPIPLPIPVVFTFQSGYIQMQSEVEEYAWANALYIPIWLYSNVRYPPLLCLMLLPLHSNLVIFKSEPLSITSYMYHFTFQSGYIQIYNRRMFSRRLFELYIPIWLYSNCYPNPRYTGQTLALHSNLVIFK